MIGLYSGFLQRLRRVGLFATRWWARRLRFAPAPYPTTFPLLSLTLFEPPSNRKSLPSTPGVLSSVHKYQSPPIPFGHAEDFDTKVVLLTILGRQEAVSLLCRSGKSPHLSWPAIQRHSP